VRFFEFVDTEASIAEAATSAAQSDVALVFVGTTNEIESEGYDRDTMDLLPDQYLLIQAVADKNPRTVVVNFSGGPVNLAPIVGSVAGLVQAWFPGQECGRSVARVLTGRVNPSGRLPFSWPARLEDNPSCGNFPVDEDDVLRYEEGLNVGYRYYDWEKSPAPLFPFGFGLSYTTFGLSASKAAGSKMSPVGPDGSIDISYMVANIGDRAGKAVVQFYIQSPTSAERIGQQRPVKELKAFKKVELEASESATVTVTLDKYSVSIYDAAAGCWFAEKGTYKILVGFSATEIAEQVVFEVPESFTWKGI
jgi:beta-glucosidase